MSDVMSATLRVPRRVSLTIAVPATLAAYKMYLIAALAGADLYAPAGTVSFLFGNWHVRRGDIIDMIATGMIFVELMKVTRIDERASQFRPSVLLRSAPSSRWRSFRQR
jgi:hypothetical protein